MEFSRYKYALECDDDGGKKCRSACFSFKRMNSVDQKKTVLVGGTDGVLN